MKTVLLRVVVYLLLNIIFFPSLVLGKEPCVTAKLFGQLGNQCFQIATASSLAWDNGVEASFPDLVTETHDGIPVNRKEFFWRLNTSNAPLINVHKYTESYYEYLAIPYKLDFVHF